MLINLWTFLGTTLHFLLVHNRNMYIYIYVDRYTFTVHVRMCIHMYVQNMRHGLELFTLWLPIANIIPIATILPNTISIAVLLLFPAICTSTISTMITISIARISNNHIWVLFDFEAHVTALRLPLIHCLSCLQTSFIQIPFLHTVLTN